MWKEKLEQPLVTKWQHSIDLLARRPMIARYNQAGFAGSDDLRDDSMTNCPELRDIDLVEERYTESGEPSLGDALRLLARRWQEGARDRETALRLLFLQWFSLTEPPFLTGLYDEVPPSFSEVFDGMGGINCEDPEFHFVLTYMCDVFPFACGKDEAVWAERSLQFRARYEHLGVPLPEASVFKGRGAYGEYFAHIVDSGWYKSYW